MDRSRAGLQLLVGIVIVVVFLLLAANAAEATTADTLALLRLKALVSDPNGALESWNNNNSIRRWKGVNCSPQGRVVGLDLESEMLSGPFPGSALGALSELQSLNMAANNFSGTLSPDLFLGGLGHNCSLQHLDLSRNNLTGAVPLLLGSSCKKSLKLLNLSHNQLSGGLPTTVIIMGDALERLDLSYNSISGSIPPSLFTTSTSCKSLQVLDFSHNHLTGEVPGGLVTNCLALREISLASNELTGTFPALNSSNNLQKLSLSSNNLTGLEIVGCTELEELDISSNKMAGRIFNFSDGCASLKLLNLSSNAFSGEFSALGISSSSMTSLEALDASYNSFTGPIPSTPADSTGLKLLDLSSNRFETVTDIVCSASSALERLLLSNNRLSGPVPSSIMDCHRLQMLDMSFNSLSGSIPSDICTTSLVDLRHLLIWSNSLQGEIPPSLGECKNLRTLILSFNSLHGSIPPELSTISGLEWLSLSSNNLSGSIPRSLGNLQNLSFLQLNNNSLEGQIPVELGDCRRLIWLDLSSNSLSGSIPLYLGPRLPAPFPSATLGDNVIAFAMNSGPSCKGLGGLFEFQGIHERVLLELPVLKSCNITRFYRAGSYNLSKELTSLLSIDLSYNNLSGSIPAEMGYMHDALMIDLGHNHLSGMIPSTFGQLKSLNVLDLSQNALEGQLPDSLCNLNFLSSFDVSDNDLSGQIPQKGQLTTFPAESYARNPGLCGFPLTDASAKCPFTASAAPPPSPARPPRRRRTSWWSKQVLVGTLVSGILMLGILACWTRWGRKRLINSSSSSRGIPIHENHKGSSSSGEPLSINVALFEKPLHKITYEDLFKATNGFSPESMIGFGGSGEVYQAQLRDGSVVAVKKLLRFSIQGDREFMAEMETLGKIQHRNLVSLLGYCRCRDEKLLVYEFMPNGNLEQLLHEVMRPKGIRAPVPWEMRKQIAMGAARGLCFLHHNCIPHIIHRDMKSSNVLLDNNLEAKVSDFGMARLMSASDTHLSVTTLSGTPGYVPPEYYQSFRCTRNGDVYSYGVILLELLTRKRPTDKEEFGDNCNLVGWVRACVRQGRSVQALDPEMRVVNNKAIEEEMLEYLRVACSCLDDQPHKRPSMLQVVARFKELALLHDHAALP